MNMRAIPPRWGLTIVRVMAGVIITVAGTEKLAAGFPAFTQVVTSLSIPLPQFWGVFIPFLEAIGGALLILGLGARWVAILFTIEYFVTSIVLKVPRQPPFGGWESMRIDMMLLASAIMVVLAGPGALALESILFRRRGEAVAAGRPAVT